MTYAKIVLLLLKIADVIAEYLRRQKYEEAGYNKALAESSAGLLKKSTFAKAVLDEMTAKTSDETDAVLKGLEP